MLTTNNCQRQNANMLPILLLSSFLKYDKYLAVAFKKQIVASSHSVKYILNIIDFILFGSLLTLMFLNNFFFLIDCRHTSEFRIRVVQIDILHLYFYQLDEKFPTDNSKVWPTFASNRYFRIRHRHTHVDLKEFVRNRRKENKP